MLQLGMQRESLFRFGGQIVVIRGALCTRNGKAVNGPMLLIKRRLTRGPGLKAAVHPQILRGY